MKRKVFWLPCWRCLGGPPCRSVSALRHAPGPFAPSSTWQWGRCQKRGQSSFCLAGPKPVRSEEHPCGLPTNSPADQQLVEDDSILWLRVLQQPPTTLFTTFFSPPFGRLDVSGGFPWLCTAELHDTELCGDTSGCRGEAQEGIGFAGWGLKTMKEGHVLVRGWYGPGTLIVFFVCVFFCDFVVDCVGWSYKLFLVGCWRGNMMQWYVYKCIHYIDIFLSVGECEKRQFQWFGQPAQFANWFHLGIWWWSCMWEKCFFFPVGWAMRIVMQETKRSWNTSQFGLFFGWGKYVQEWILQRCC